MNVYSIKFDTLDLGGGVADVAAETPDEAMFLLRSKGYLRERPSEYLNVSCVLTSVCTTFLVPTLIHEVIAGVLPHKGGKYILIKGDQGIQGPPVPIDTELDTASTNAVENRVIALELQAIKNILSSLTNDRISATLAAAYTSRTLIPGEAGAVSLTLNITFAGAALPEYFTWRAQYKKGNGAWTSFPEGSNKVIISVGESETTGTINFSVDGVVTDTRTGEEYPINSKDSVTLHYPVYAGALLAETETYTATDIKTIAPVYNVSQLYSTLTVTNDKPNKGVNYVIALPSVLAGADSLVGNKQFVDSLDCPVAFEKESNTVTLHGKTYYIYRSANTYTHSQTTSVSVRIKTLS